MYRSETIAAISTALNDSGISVVRMSGPDSIRIIDEIFVSVKKDKKMNNVSSHTVHYGTIVEEDKVIDEVLVIIMKAPNTYTREDIVEIDCHGGVFVTNKILEILIKHGARIAEPGEFTKRAFLNGRIDLSQAEAVTDLINAKTGMAASASVAQLRGNIKSAILKMREQIIHEIAYIEAALDDPEHIEMNDYGKDLIAVVEPMIKEIEQMIDSADNGRMIQEGIRTVILGKPNAGKSSIMNRLLKEERAIVTEVAGTTRDTLEETMRLSEFKLNIIDTAGIRKTDDIVEKIGVERAKEAASKADLIIYVIDATTGLDESDIEIMSLISDKKVIVLLNKSDLECIVTEKEMNQFIPDSAPIVVSAKEDIGITEIERRIKEMFYIGDLSYNDELYITNMRHKELLMEALNSLKLVMNSICQDLPEDFYSIDLMNAYEQLGKIIGESVSDDLVNEIFSKFCMGK